MAIEALTMEVFRKIVFIIGAVGTFSFGALFLASFLNPGFVERTAAQVIRHQVEKEVRQKIDALDNSFLMAKASELMKRQAEESLAIKQKLTARLSEKLSAEIAQLNKLDCECRKKIETRIRGGFEWRVTNLTQAQERLQTLIRTKYMETAEKLTREFRIFTGANAVVFLLLLITAYRKKRADLHLLPAAIVLLGAAGLTAYFYLFNQNWLHTIVFNDYVGLAYVGYLSVAVAMLADVLMNRARVTVKILNAIANVVGSAASMVPC
jgi:hypothetical protein